MTQEIIEMFDAEGNPFYGYEKEVKKSGNGGAMTMPKELVGKKVIVLWLKKKEVKNDNRK